MAKTSLVVKQKRTHRFKVRNYTRCNRCGRPRVVFNPSPLPPPPPPPPPHNGSIPGMTKSSW
jgi:small subunit ribosomal protein S14